MTAQRSTDPGLAPSRARRLYTAFADRVGRASPTAMPRPIAVLTIVVWCVLALLAVVIVLPFAPEFVVQLGQFTPLPAVMQIASLIVGAGAVAASLLSGGAANDTAAPPRPLASKLGASAAIILPPLVPLLLLLAQRMLPFALIVAALWVALIVFFAWSGRGFGRDHPVATALTLGLLACAPWQLSATVAAVEWDGLLAAHWYIALLFPAAAIVAVFLVRELLDAAQDRVERTGATMLRRQPAIWHLWLTLGIVLVVIALRLTVLRDIFGAEDGQLWGLGEPSSFAHAAILAACIFVFATRSVYRPLRPRGHRAVFFVLIVGATSLFLIVAASSLLQLVQDAVHGGFTPPEFASDGVVSIIYFSAGLALVLLVPWILRPSTTGGVVLIVALIDLLPTPILNIVEASTGIEVPPISGSLSMMLLILTGLVTIALVVGLARGRRFTPPLASLQWLLVVPIVVVHATVLLPDEWETPLIRVVFVVGGALAFFRALPPLGASEPIRHAAIVLRATAVLGIFYVAVLLASASGAIFEDGTAQAALLWLAAPLIALLCSTVGRADAGAAAKPTVSLEHTRA